MNAMFSPPGASSRLDTCVTLFAPEGMHGARQSIAQALQPLGLEVAVLRSKEELIAHLKGATRDQVGTVLTTMRTNEGTLLAPSVAKALRHSETWRYTPVIAQGVELTEGEVGLFKKRGGNAVFSTINTNTLQNTLKRVQDQPFVLSPEGEGYSGPCWRGGFGVQRGMQVVSIDDHGNEQRELRTFDRKARAWVTQPPAGAPKGLVFLEPHEKGTDGERLRFMYSYAYHRRHTERLMHKYAVEAGYADAYNWMWEQEQWMVAAMDEVDKLPNRATLLAHARKQVASAA